MKNKSKKKITTTVVAMIFALAITLPVTGYSQAFRNPVETPYFQDWERSCALGVMVATVVSVIATDGAILASTAAVKAITITGSRAAGSNLINATAAGDKAARAVSTQVLKKGMGKGLFQKAVAYCIGFTGTREVLRRIDSSEKESIQEDIVETGKFSGMYRGNRGG